MAFSGSARQPLFCDLEESLVERPNIDKQFKEHYVFAGFVLRLDQVSLLIAFPDRIMQMLSRKSMDLEVYGQRLTGDCQLPHRG